MAVEKWHKGGEYVLSSETIYFVVFFNFNLLSVYKIYLNKMYLISAGRGGASIYGKQFEDELHPELKFTGE